MASIIGTIGRSALQGVLEDLIDQHGLTAVLTEIREICDGKGDHLRSNWQDEPNARIWDRAAVQIGNTADRLGKILPKALR